MIMITEFSIESLDGSGGILSLGRFDYRDEMECTPQMWDQVLSLFTEACAVHGLTLTCEDGNSQDYQPSLFSDTTEGAGDG